MSRWASAAASRRARRLCAARTGAACEWRGSSTCDEPAVADVGQRREHVGQVDLALAEGQVLVHAAAHVVDLDVDDEVAGGADDLGRAVVLAAREVTDVDGQPAAPRGGRAARRARRRRRPARGTCPARARAPASRRPPARPAAAGSRPPRRGPGPARPWPTAAGSPLQHETTRAPRSGAIRSAVATRSMRRSRPSSLTKRRVVLAPGVQHVATPGLDDDVEVVPAQQRGGVRDPLRPAPARGGRGGRGRG